MADMEPALPDGLTCRPMSMTDVPDVTALLEAHDRHFMGESFLDEADVTGQWSRTGMDFEADTQGVLDSSELVAIADVDRGRHLHIDVRPSHLGRGIGFALAEWAEGIARSRGWACAEQESAVADAAGSALLEGRGYVPTDADWVLRLDEGARLVHHVLPADVSIESFHEEDAVAVHALIEDAFSEWKGRIGRPYEEWRVQNLGREAADSSYWRVARAGGELVGACVVHDSGVATWIHQLAVRSDRRHQGIAQELLAFAYEAGRARGRATGELSTSGRAGALELYLRLGMRIVGEWRTWELQL